MENEVKDQPKERKKRTSVEKKNYSFYMPTDFIEKLETAQAMDPLANGLSYSQANYYLISKLAAESKSEGQE